jgi:hypothetical protein
VRYLPDIRIPPILSLINDLAANWGVPSIGFYSLDWQVIKPSLCPQRFDGVFFRRMNGIFSYSMPSKSYRSVFISDNHLGTRECRSDFLSDFLSRCSCERINKMPYLLRR